MKKMKALKIGAAIISLVVLLVMSMAGVASANSLRWYLYDSDHHFPPGADSSYIMSKDMCRPDGCAEGTVPIHNGENIIWIADEAATVTVSFPEATWHGRLDVRNGAGKCTVEIGKWVSDGAGSGTFYPYGASTEVTFAGARHPENLFSVLPGAFDILAGEYLACRITAIDGKALVHCGSGPSNYGLSWIEYPWDNPPYPVPELPAAVLFGVGILGLVGFVGWRTLQIKH